jgi:hypothetical protein
VPTELPLKPWRRRSIKTTSATVAHAIAVNILDLPLSRSTVLVRSMPSDILTELRKCKANARKKSDAVAVDRIGSMLDHGGLAAAREPSNVTR